MSVVFVKESASTAVEGRRVRLQKDEAWDADDPVVKARPDLFVDRPERVMVSTEKPARTASPIEQATAAPGEKRTTKKSAAKRSSKS